MLKLFGKCDENLGKCKRFQFPAQRRNAPGTALKWLGRYSTLRRKRLPPKRGIPPTG
ncbi:hypothetical protein Rmet_6638 (plasmid) [Cupriavidus metallidurans CH34]|uniref:Uncharacterized protein n=1 Tax=Cupriavidus metallidurans (strain ATCC 43123 / DSM 2839 / NBRC 102507 / CH34) TaxID=266264 RepID=D3DY68_CUPMC|nr:hypothetical protein Rmet_6638 [Cupriavidus metallidurans CH34]